MDTSNEMTVCSTCIEPSMREENYQEVDDIYRSTESNSATAKAQFGEYCVRNYVVESPVAERMRKLNKLVAKWR